MIDRSKDKNRPRAMDDIGRVVIPRWVRDEFGWEAGQTFLITISPDKDDSIILTASGVIERYRYDINDIDE